MISHDNQAIEQSGLIARAVRSARTMSRFAYSSTINSIFTGGFHSARVDFGSFDTFHVNKFLDLYLYSVGAHLNMPFSISGIKNLS